VSQQYISLDQAAGMLGVHWTTLQSWLKTNGIKYETVGEYGRRVHLVKSADFAKFLKTTMMRPDPKEV